MKLTFPRVGIAILLLFAFLIRDDLFPAHEPETAHVAVDAAPVPGAEERTAQGPETSPSGDAGDEAGAESGADAATVAAPGEMEPGVMEHQVVEPEPDSASSDAAYARASEAEDLRVAPGVGPARNEAIAAAPPAATEPQALPETLPEPAPAAPVAKSASDPVTPVTEPEPQWSVTEYWVAARTAYMLGDQRRAREEYTQLLSVEPGNWFAHEELGNVYARNRQPEKAVHHYQRAALLLVDAGRFDEARKLALRMAEMYPSWKDGVPEGLADH